MRKSKHRFVFFGVDFGATTLKVDAVDEHGNPLLNERVEMPSHASKGPEATVGRMVQLVKRASRRLGVDFSNIGGVGLDSPCPSSPGGVVLEPANLVDKRWRGFPLREKLDIALTGVARRKIPVTHDNDGNAAALAEAALLPERFRSAVVALLPGTGLGGGFAIDGEIYRGRRGMAAEVGHVILDHRPFVEGEPMLCGCGKYNCAEATTSLCGLTRTLGFMFDNPDVVPTKWHGHELLKPLRRRETWKHRALQVRGLAGKRDKLCLALFDWQAEALGKLAATSTILLDPSAIVIGGGIIEGTSELTARIMRRVQRSFRSGVFATQASGQYIRGEGRLLPVKIVPAQLGDTAGCRGAALAVLSAFQTAAANQV